tara:strand:+ start:5692 stop:6198 length:507 start_codon:yes stop_codon:yes gene_type:complete
VETNDVLNILHKHQEKWLQIAKNLLYKEDDQLIKDIIQEMYLSIAEQLHNKKLKADEVIINNKPHFGIIKKTILQIIQIEAKRKNKYNKNENLEILNVASNENSKYLEEDINNLINNFYWFDKKLLKLYTKKFNSVRSLAKETKLGHVTVFEVINKCKKKIKKRLYEK